MHTQDTPPVLLLIDDSPSIHRLLAFKLKNEGIEFLSAFSGPEGVELAAANKPSLILLDLAMPDVDGFTSLLQLKNDSRTINIPVIVVSGTSSPEDKVRAFELGAMDFVTKPFDVHELRARISSALRIHRLMSMLEKRAQIDGLTGLWNRAHFNDRLAAELSCSRRNGSTMSLVVCDLDHFKRVNDTFGHPAGDAVLQGFAATLNAELRSYDIACRYGGEEFAIILPDAAAPQAHMICERIRAAIEARRWPNYPDIRATASFGVTDKGIDGSDAPAAWVEAADKCLYEAKQTGRNRVVAFSGPTERPRLAKAG
ncbi:MAG: diguanylate cyclase [Planctomycetota bacterium]|nr:diguanylate cyclase [Planctomycetota bacterium]